MVLSQGNVSPQGSLAMSGDIFRCRNWLGGGSPGKLLHILQGSGQPPTTSNCPAPNVTNAEAEDPWPREERGVLF